MFVHTSNWTTMETLLGELLPAKFAAILPAIRGTGVSSPPSEKQNETLLWFVSYLQRQGKSDQLSALEEHTGFSFPNLIYMKAKEYYMRPYELCHPPDFLSIFRYRALRKIIVDLDATDDIDDRKLIFITWLCEQIKGDAPSEIRDTFIVFVTTLAVYTKRPDIIDYATKTLPPTRQSLYEDFVCMVFECCESSYPTPILHRLVEGFGLSDTELLQKCRPYDVLRRHFLCESEEDAKWLLRCACSLSKGGDPWLLTAWDAPKSEHKKYLMDAVFDNIRVMCVWYKDRATIKRRIGVFANSLCKILPSNVRHRLLDPSALYAIDHQQVLVVDSHTWRRCS